MKEIPNWLKRYLKQNDLLLIRQAIEKAEATTSGEIVPMIVKSSVTTGHVPLVVVREVFIFVLAFMFIMVKTGHEAHAWLLLVLIALGLGELYFGFTRTSLGMLRRSTPRIDIHQQVYRRALAEFYNANLHQTTGKTGVLIFVSLFERKAFVLADKGISEKMPPETWDHLVRLLITQIKEDQMAGGYVRAIEECAKILAPHFPPVAGNPNELVDKLVIVE